MILINYEFMKLRKGFKYEWQDILIICLNMHLFLNHALNVCETDFNDKPTQFINDSKDPNDMINDGGKA